MLNFDTGIRETTIRLDPTQGLYTDEDDFRKGRWRETKLLEGVLCSFIQWVFVVIQGGTCQKQGNVVFQAISGQKQRLTRAAEIISISCSCRQF